jgi:hypothetical protein
MTYEPRSFVTQLVLVLCEVMYRGFVLSSEHTFIGYTFQYTYVLFYRLIFALIPNTEQDLKLHSTCRILQLSYEICSSPGSKFEG